MLARGEKIVASLIEFCHKEKIKSGCFNAIGAINKVEMAHFNPVTKKYHSKHIAGAPASPAGGLEIVSLMGNITYNKKDIVIHSHIAVGDERMRLYGGHLKEATVSVTCEIVMREFNTKLTRSFNKDTGLNLIKI